MTEEHILFGGVGKLGGMNGLSGSDGMVFVGIFSGGRSWCLVGVLGVGKSVVGGGIFLPPW